MNVLNIHGEDDDDEPSEPGGEGGSDSGSGVSAWRSGEGEVKVR